MKNYRLGLLLLGALICCGTLAQNRRSESWSLRYEGVGPARVGMTVAQLRAAFRPEILTEEDSGNEACFYLQPKQHPQLAFMMIGDRVVRIDVRDSSIATASGIRVGDSEAKALKTYGSAVKVEPHAYSAPDGHYLTIRSRDGRYGLRFETYKGKIEAFYAGRTDAIQYIEGCE